MALKTAFKNFRMGVSEEIREVKSLLSRMSTPSENSALGANFRKFGTSFGTYDFDAFLDLSRNFYTEGMVSRDPLYTLIHMRGNRIAIDYNGEIRGIFSNKGTPLAFYRPDFRQLGYANKGEELAAFRSNVVS